MKRNLYQIFLLIIVCSTFDYANALPNGFVYLEYFAPNIVQEMRYASHHNFMGRNINGYVSPRCILTREAATALNKIQIELQQKSQERLVVYDCYRPTRAVKDFVQWSQNDDQKMKPQFYPRELKSDLFKRGYIAKNSAHSRGSTVDLSIYGASTRTGVKSCFAPNRKRDASVDMGSNYDCLDPVSNVHNSNISQKARKNRMRLAKLMKKYGFRPYSKEWWHFSLRNEPIKRTYFNFPVK